MTDVAIRVARQPPFASGIYAIVDADRLSLHTAAKLQAASAQMVALACAAVEAGAVAVQLRIKCLACGHPVRTALAARLRSAIAGQVPVIVNDDVAAAQAAACGVHVGVGDVAVADARAALGDLACIGLSTHDLAQVQASAGSTADYLGFGPVRATTSKRRADPVTGWALLTDACARSTLPVVAIGGLDIEDAVLAQAAGAHAMAAIGAWLGPAAAPHSVAEARAALSGLALAWTAAKALAPKPGMPVD